MKICYQFSFSTMALSKKSVMAALLLLLLITSQGKSGMSDWLFVWYYLFVLRMHSQYSYACLILVLLFDGLEYKFALYSL